ncbi:MAG: SLC13/DASS family transporter [Bacteroidales bacterium]|nr:SLC13/DASS family transporter [Bacteroidales bacterium]
MDNKKLINLAIALLIPILIALLPSGVFPFDISVVEQRIVAIFFFAALMWILEPIPIWTTSVSVIVLMLLTTSTSMCKLFGLSILDAEGKFDTKLDPEFGKLIPYKDIMATFADPVIMLFMGGFVLAIIASKYKLDAGIAKLILTPFGNKSEMVLLGFIVVTAVCSMFMSNTATAAMMLTILTPVLATLPEGGKGKIALALSIPVAANVGGIGTPIGTPPNALAIKYLNDPEGLNLGISFGEWMLYMVPLALLILFITWILLRKMFPFSSPTIKISIEESFKLEGWKSITVLITFIGTILLWVTDKLTGINANVVALIPFGVFAVTGIFTKDDLKKIDWDVLWLVAGGFALGVGLDKTGLAEHLVTAIPFDTWPTMLIIIGSGILCCVMSTFMSNSATAALLIPILLAVGKGIMPQLEPYGGISTLLIGLALSASFAMSLPISTPPNALAYAKGFIKQKDMATVGIIVGVISIALAYTELILFKGL